MGAGAGACTVRGAADAAGGVGAAGEGESTNVTASGGRQRSIHAPSRRHCSGVGERLVQRCAVCGRPGGVAGIGGAADDALLRAAAGWYAALPTAGVGTPSTDVDMALLGSSRLMGMRRGG